MPYFGNIPFREWEKVIVGNSHALHERATSRSAENLLGEFTNPDAHPSHSGSKGQTRMIVRVLGSL